MLLTLITFLAFKSGSFCEIKLETSIAHRSLLIYENIQQPVHSQAWHLYVLLIYKSGIN